jgi:putative ABC transport system permease protein
MFKSALLTFFRSFTRHPSYALLNLLGLSFGIAVFITLSLLYRFETSYESWTVERPHIYAMGVRLHMPGMPDDLVMQTMGGLLNEIQTSYPQIDGTRTWEDYFIVHRGDDVFAEHMQIVDANFLTFFQVPMLRGNAARALAEPSDVVLSARIARKYFGTIEVVGRPLTLSDAEGVKTYTVSAVIADLPKNSDMQLDMLRPLTPERVAKYGDFWHTWGIVTVKTYLKFKRPADAAAFAAQMPTFTDRQAGATFGREVIPHKLLELSLVPLADEHLINPKLKAAISALGLVGIVALMLALINYVNLAVVRAGLRAREVAVRKTLGASPSALRVQFLIEAVLILLFAFLTGLSAVELSLPLVNAAGGLSLKLNYRLEAEWILMLVGCVLSTGLIAALYPAFVLSAFKPAQVLASSRMPGGGSLAGWLRTGLAMVQFTVVVVALILMTGFILQIRHIQTADLGFQRDSLLIAGGLANPAVTPAQRETFLAVVRGVPAVRYVSIANAVPGPGMGPGNFGQIARPGQSDSMAEALKVNVQTVGPDYFQMLGTKLLAGRLFDSQHGEDDFRGQPGDPADRAANILISRNTVRDMGFASPHTAVGQTAMMGEMPVRIIGVVENIRFESPNQVIPARVYMLDLQAEYGFGMVRYQGKSEPEMRQDLNNVWRHINPTVPLDVVSVVTNLDGYYKLERDRSHLFSIGTGMAALIGCIGLYGMATFNTGRRVHEIGMRKVLGASREQIVRLLLVQFLRPVAIASLIAWPLAWLILQRWLAQFDDVITMPLWIFPSASVIALLIALMTVGGVAFAAARAEPGKALRHE